MAQYFLCQLPPNTGDNQANIIHIVYQILFRRYKKPDESFSLEMFDEGYFVFKLFTNNNTFEIFRLETYFQNTGIKVISNLAQYLPYNTKNEDDVEFFSCDGPNNLTIQSKFNGLNIFSNSSISLSKLQIQSLDRAFVDLVDDFGLHFGGRTNFDELDYGLYIEESTEKAINVSEDSMVITLEEDEVLADKLENLLFYLWKLFSSYNLTFDVFMPQS